MNNSKNASRGAMSLAMMALSFLLLYVAWSITIGNDCLSLDSLGPLLQLGTLIITCSFLCWMTAIFMAGGARATKDGMVPALITELIAFFPILFIIGLMVTNIIFPEASISISDVVPSNGNDENDYTRESSIASTC